MQSNWDKFNLSFNSSGEEMEANSLTPDFNQLLPSAESTTIFDQEPKQEFSPGLLIPAPWLETHAQRNPPPPTPISDQNYEDHYRLFPDLLSQKQDNQRFAPVHRPSQELSQDHVGFTGFENLAREHQVQQFFTIQKALELQYYSNQYMFNALFNTPNLEVRSSCDEGFDMSSLRPPLMPVFEDTPLSRNVDFGKPVRISFRRDAFGSTAGAIPREFKAGSGRVQKNLINVESTFKEPIRPTTFSNLPECTSTVNPSSNIPFRIRYSEQASIAQETKIPHRNSSKGPFCQFCHKNGEPFEIYGTHYIKTIGGKVSCPVLRKYICEFCGSTGDNAHTRRYCPKNAAAVRELPTYKRLANTNHTKQSS